MLKKCLIFHPATGLEWLERKVRKLCDFWLNYFFKSNQQPAGTCNPAVLHSVFTRSSNMLSPGLLLDLPQLDTDLRTSPVRFLLPSLLIWLDGKLHSEGVRSSPMRTLFPRLRNLDLYPHRSWSSRKPQRRPVKAHQLQTSSRWDPITPRSSRSIKRWWVRWGEDGVNRRPGFWSWLLLPLLSNASIWESGLNKSRFFSPLSFSSSSPCSFQMNSLPSFCRCFSGQCLGGGEEYVCVCVC